MARSSFLDLLNRPNRPVETPVFPALVGPVLEPTVGSDIQPTVGLDSQPTVGFDTEPTAGRESTPTVGPEPEPTVLRGVFYLAEDLGALFPATRVKRIDQAQ